MNRYEEDVLENIKLSKEKKPYTLKYELMYSSDKKSKTLDIYKILDYSPVQIQFLLKITKQDNTIPTVVILTNDDGYLTLQDIISVDNSIHSINEYNSFISKLEDIIDIELYEILL